MPDEMKLPPGVYIKLQQPEPIFDCNAERWSASCCHELVAQIADVRDEVVCREIVKYAIKKGYTDLIIIDEEFVKSAIIHEIERRQQQ